MNWPYRPIGLLFTGKEPVMIVRVSVKDGRDYSGVQFDREKYLREWQKTHPKEKK